MFFSESKKIVGARLRSRSLTPLKGCEPVLTKHRSIRVLLFVLILALQSMLVPTTAYAASDYDGISVKGGSLIISYHAQPWTGVTCTQNVFDLTTSWSSLILDASKWDIGSGAATSDPIDAIEDFQDAIDRGTGWGVTQSYNNEGGLNSFGSSLSAYGGTYDKWLTVWWNNTGTASFHEVSPYGPTLMADGNVHVAWIYFSGAPGHHCEPRVTQHVLDIASPAVNAVMAIDNSAFTAQRWLPVFLNFEVTHPSGYEGSEPLTQVPAPTYVAMGDSFSTAEGNPPFEAGTDEDGVNKCHRSPQAYPRLLQSDLGGMDFVACSGATTSNVLNGQWNEPAQVDALSNNTRIVTITVGGNDIKFKKFAIACVMGTTCDSTSSEYQESWEIMTDSGRSDYLPDKLASLLDTVKTYLYANPNFQVYVVGYPYVVTHASWEDNAPGTCNYLTEAEANAAVSIVQELDTTIHTAVTVFDDPRFVYVDPLATGSPFLGHELCTSGGYFNGIEASGAFGGNDAYVFHPNENGQQAYADLIESYMS